MGKINRNKKCKPTANNPYPTPIIEIKNEPSTTSTVNKTEAIDTRSIQTTRVNSKENHQNENQQLTQTSSYGFDANNKTQLILKKVFNAFFLFIFLIKCLIREYK